LTKLLGRGEEFEQARRVQKTITRILEGLLVLIVTMREDGGEDKARVWAGRKKSPTPLS